MTCCYQEDRTWMFERSHQSGSQRSSCINHGELENIARIRLTRLAAGDRVGMIEKGEPA